MNELEHLHLTVNAKINPSGSHFSKEKAQAFIDELMEVTDMKPLGPLNWSDAVDLDFPGQSFVQMITTSHTSLHYFSSTNEIYFDLYSCKFFEIKRVIELLHRTFGIVEWHGSLYNRANNKPPKIEMIGSQKECFILDQKVIR